jgi:hypothetical protein
VSLGDGNVERPGGRPGNGAGQAERPEEKGGRVYSMNSTGICNGVTECCRRVSIMLVILVIVI